MVADEVDSIKYKIEGLSESISNTGIDTSIDHLADAVALSIIAQHGNEEDRAIVVSKLETWFEEFRGY